MQFIQNLSESFEGSPFESIGRALESLVDEFLEQYGDFFGIVLEVGKVDLIVNARFLIVFDQTGSGRGESRSVLSPRTKVQRTTRGIYVSADLDEPSSRRELASGKTRHRRQVCEMF
jgi:hypothetical protein